ncbi:P-loop containing nucleoside triphosphate hydrolase protein [Neocallimastix lanati (nom. inval.)]|jgi:ATP-binding cassette subfamily A (ABC1) protein 5|nr:P-loop containing nucleoside triphosphate hydrolase protein [Neocallimastix sp. JGI-2020a]
MSVFINHLKAIIYRNMIVKKNKKKKLLLEILFPIVVTILLCILKILGKPILYNAEDSINIGNLETTFNINDKNANTISFVFNHINNEEQNFLISRIMNGKILKKRNLKYIIKNDEYNINNDPRFNYTIFDNLLALINISNKDNGYYTTIEMLDSNYLNYNLDPLNSYGHSRAHPSKIISNKYLNGISYLQSLVESALVSLKTNSTVNYDINIGFLSKPPIKYNASENVKTKIYSLLSSFIFIIFIPFIVKLLQRENEKKINETALVIGVNPATFILSWEIIYSILMIILSLIITAILIFTKTYQYVSSIILYITILFYGLSNCGIGMIFSTIFQKSKRAGSICITVLMCISYLCFFYVGKYSKIIFGLLLSPITFSSIMEEININEMRGEKIIAFGNLNGNISTLQLIKYLFKGEIDIYIFLENWYQSSIGIYMLILLVNALFYYYLAIIFNIILKKGFKSLKNGKSYVEIPESQNHYYTSDVEDDPKDNENCLVEVSDVSKAYEIESPYQKEYFIIKLVKKETLIVLRHINFKVYKDEIFGILGKNGVGKSVLLNIMTGLESQSSGNIYFNGVNINTDISKIHKDFGICPQVNNLYNELTVTNYIKTYAKIKNVKVDINQILKEINLENNKNSKIINLSKSQKRKLCIGIAFIGDPKYVFLDEPTVGLDYSSKKQIWSLLLNKKKDRVIFLVTTDMEEADIIANRKLILSHNKIRCLGSSLYLKEHFNMKYTVDIESKEFDKLNEIINRHIPESYYYVQNEDDQLVNINTNIKSWKLPISSTSKFPELFQELDSLMTREENSIIKNYSLSIPTLEELFVRLVDEYSDDNINPFLSRNSGESRAYSDDNTIFIDAYEETLDNHQSSYETGDITSISENNNHDNDDNTIIVNMNDGASNKEKPISNFKKILSLLSLRINIHINNIDFSNYVIIFPIIISGIVYRIIDYSYENVIFNGYDNSLLNITNEYNKNIFNINSNNVNIPNFTTDLYRDTIYNYSLFNVTEYDDKTLNEIGKSFNKEEYYVSSISGLLENNNNNNNNNNNYKFNINYNASLENALPVTLNAITNTILTSKNITDKVTTYSSLTKIYTDHNHYQFIITGVFLGLLTFSYMFCTTFFGPLIVNERNNKIDQQLYLRGVSRKIYWISSIIAEAIILYFTSIFAINSMLWRYSEAFLSFKNFIIIFFSSLLWSIASITYQFIISLFIKKEKSAKILVPLVNTISVFIEIFIFSIVNDLTTTNNPNKIFSTSVIIIEIIFTLINPSFGILSILNAYFIVEYYEISTKIKFSTTSLLKFNTGIIPIMITLLVAIILYFILLIALDKLKSNKFSKSIIYSLNKETAENNVKIMKETDEDVYNEYINIQENTMDYSMSVLQLSKEYKVNHPPHNKKRNNNVKNYQYGDIHQSKYNKKDYVKTAVEDISFGVKNKECFGILGFNKSGKSTILEMIISEQFPTTGNIYYDGIDSHQIDMTKLSFGYLPQKDIFWKDLTVKKNINYFLKIRGYSKEKIKELTKKFISDYHLEFDKDLNITQLSYGIKRKLCLLLALCDNPKRIILDEPTLGMDPIMKRHIWKILKDTIKNTNHTSIIITTTSVEEAQILCDRIGVLIDGRFISIGSPEHIKMKYCHHKYILEVQSSEIEKFHQRVIEEDQLLGSNNNYKIIDKFNDLIKYEVSISNGIGRIFEVMEGCKSSGLVLNYSFGQISLDQVILNFYKYSKQK